MLTRRTDALGLLTQMVEAAAAKASENLGSPVLTGCECVEIRLPDEGAIAALEAWVVGSGADAETIAVYAITTGRQGERLAAHGRFSFGGSHHAIGGA